MKKYFLVIVFLSAAFVVAAQSVSFKDISLDEACIIAKKENKIVMIVVESAKCSQCNDVAMKGLSGSVIKRNTDNTCVIIKRNEVPKELRSTDNLFEIQTLDFGVIYLDCDKNILNIQKNSSSSYASYLDQIENAITEKEGGDNSIVKLKKDYYNNISGFFTTQKLIDKIKGLKLEPSETLLDDFAQKAPKDSLESISFLQYLIKCAPVYNSIAHKVSYKNADNYNMAWYRMSLSERRDINTRFNQKSIDKAIKNKDASYAYAVANGIRNQYQSNGADVMQRNYQRIMLDYYKGVKDSSMYIRSIIPYINQYFMSINVDSIARLDSMQRQKMSSNVAPIKSEELDRLLKEAKESGKSSTNIVKQFVTTSTNVSPLGQYYCNSLNEAAWTVYTFTKDIGMLNKALIFSKRANEFLISPEAMDTYARLLYKTGNKSEAINWETKAIAAMKIRGFGSNRDFEKVLIKMQADDTIIDQY